MSGTRGPGEIPTNSGGPNQGGLFGILPPFQVHPIRVYVLPDGSTYQADDPQSWAQLEMQGGRLAFTVNNQAEIDRYNKEIQSQIDVVRANFDSDAGVLRDQQDLANRAFDTRDAAADFSHRQSVAPRRIFGGAQYGGGQYEQQKNMADSNYLSQQALANLERSQSGLDLGVAGRDLERSANQSVDQIIKNYAFTPGERDQAIADLLRQGSR